MGKILVAGLVGVETAVNVKEFPIKYIPVDYPGFEVNTEVAGGGYNVAKALTTLGDNVDFLTIIGNDPQGKNIRDKLKMDMIFDRFVTNTMKQSVSSVVLFDNECQRRTFCDLKDLQTMTYPTEYFEHAARECTFMVLCNSEFCRPLLAAAAKYKKEKLLATDVQTITGIDDEYNKDFMAAADIVFFSHENLTDTPEATAQAMMDKYGTSVVVCGLGKDGALLAVKDDNYMERIPAIDVRPVINTVGAGEALFACFCHLYHRTKDPYTAIKKAVLYAGYKVGASGATAGLMDERDLNVLAEQYIK